MSKRKQPARLSPEEIKQGFEEWFTRKNPDTPIDPDALERMTRAAIASADPSADRIATGDEFIRALRALDPILSQFSDEQTQELDRKRSYEELCELFPPRRKKP